MLISIQKPEVLLYKQQPIVITCERLARWFILCNKLMVTTCRGWLKIKTISEIVMLALCKTN